MKLRLGAVPIDPEFRPEANGWQEVRAPGPLTMQLVALPVAGVLLLVVGGLISVVAPGTRLGGDLLVALLLLLLVVPLHEVAHALLTPRFGLTDGTSLGLWPARLLFYAYYDAPLPRGRHVAVSAAPFLLLSGLPVVLLALGASLGLSASVASGLAFFAFVNAAASAGDAVGAALVLGQVARRAEVRFNGWNTYWRPASD